MKFIDKLERKFGNRGIENLTIYIIVSYVLGYALMYINPGALSMLSLNVSEILHGQIWRLVTWIIYPPSTSSALWFVIAILFFYYPISAARGGRAIADLLFGKESPSGKLPITFYKDLEGMPEFTDYSMKNRTYRYMEKEALYPFGYGLTYSDTCVTEAEVVGEVSAESDIMLKATVKNNGTVDTDEVVQVYIKDLDSPLAVRNYSLCGFKRVSLKAGEEKSVEFTISNKAMNIVDEDGNRYIAGKHFRLFAGVSQPDTRSAELTGHKPAEVEIAL